MKQYPAKTCAVCGQEWMPRDRYQATRNKTCGPACAAKRISERKAGQPSLLNRRVTVPCSVCGKPVEYPPSHLARISTPTCSYECNGKLRSAALIPHVGNMKGRKRKDPRYGPNNPAWKGGVTYFKTHGNYTGVKYVRCPEAFLPMARKDGYVMEHRLKMAKRCGYLLMRSEVVHHIDHDPRNNADLNLELWPDNASHKAFEHGRIVPGAACRFSPKV